MCASVIGTVQKEPFKDPLNADLSDLMCGCVFLWVISPNSTATVACGQEKDQQAVATNNVAQKSATTSENDEMEPENAPLKTNRKKIDKQRLVAAS